MSLLPLLAICDKVGVGGERTVTSGQSINSSQLLSVTTGEFPELRQISDGHERGVAVWDSE